MPSNTEPILRIYAESTTEYGNNGNPCLDAAGTMHINNAQISGDVLTDWDYELDISGYVSTSGSVSGGFASGSENVASFDGQMDDKGGHGGWDDTYGCSGTWKAIKK